MLISKFQFKQNFSPIIISGEVGCEKLDARIYEMLIERSQLATEHIVFIDDRLENLAAAHALGIKTAHYQREPDDFNYQADYRIKNLRELHLGVESALSDILNFL